MEGEMRNMRLLDNGIAENEHYSNKMRYQKIK
jgi:hypothetical protein